MTARLGAVIALIRLHLWAGSVPEIAEFEAVPTRFCGFAQKAGGRRRKQKQQYNACDMQQERNEHVFPQAFMIPLL